MNAVYFDIVHHIAGRIRLRISPTILKQPIAKDVNQLAQQIKNIKGIQDIRFNLAVGSVIIQYDPVAIQPTLWEKWLQDCTEGMELNHLIQHWQSQIT